MALHEHVLEVKRHLEQKDDKRLNIMRLLTEERPAGSNAENYYPDFRDYEGMWKTLQKAESKKRNLSTNSWVFDFLEAVDSAQNFPKYVSLNGENRKKLITEIHNYTAGLQKIYEENKYDDDIILNDGFFSYGFSPIEDNSEPKEKLDKISIIEALEVFSNSLASDITFAARLAQAGEDVESRLFIRHLAKRNLVRYGQPYNKVVSTASWCVFGKYHPPNTVSGALNKSYG